MILNILCFSLGAIISGIIVKLYSDKNNQQELIKVSTKLETYKTLEGMLKSDFSEIARESIRKEQEDIRKQHKEALEVTLAPLAKELGDFKTKVERFNENGIKNTTSIIEKITNLEKSSAEVSKEANLLAQALSNNQNVKGAYGEGLLDTILQYCGMQEGIHYTKQAISQVVGEDGNSHTIRPDVVLNLPDNRYLIIDSKMTLTSYLEFMKDKELLPKFKSEIKKRIIDLSEKKYQKAEGLYQPDFVLMYIPIESSLNYLYEDMDLINLAYRANVIIVGTSSLLTTIRLVSQLMSQQKQQECVKRIVSAGTNLYETFAKFCEELIDLKKRFEGLDSQFTKTINRFQRGNKNTPSLFSQVEALKDYGISSSKSIPVEFLKDTDKEKIEL